MAAAAFCCTHPRLESPEPPPRHRPLVSAASLDGLLLAAANLPDDHPHRLRFPASMRKRASKADLDVPHSPGLKGRLRMRFSRRSLLPKNDDETADAGQGVTSETAGAGIWDSDANILTTDEAARTPTSEPVHDGMSVQRSVTYPGYLDGSSEMLSNHRLEGISIDHPTVDQIQNTQDDISSISSSRKDLEWARIASHGDFISASSRIEVDILPRHDTPQRSASKTLPVSYSAPVLFMSSNDLQHSTPQPCSSTMTVVDDIPQSCQLKLRRKSSTSFDLRSLLSKHTKQDSVPFVNATDIVMTEAESVVQDGDMPITIATHDHEVHGAPCATELASHPACPFEGDAADVVSNHSAVHLQCMNIPEQLCTRSHRTTPRDHEELPTPDTPFWSFHRRERSSKDASLDGALQHPSMFDLLGHRIRPLLHRAPTPAPDASSSVYSRSCSENNEERGRLSPYDIPSTLDTNLTTWPLVGDATYDSTQAVLHCLSVDAKSAARRLQDGNRCSGADAASDNAEQGTHDSSPASNASPVTAVNNATPSQSIASSGSKPSKTSRFREMVTPPKKSVRKRRSIFRFFRPGSQKQARSSSTSVLASPAHTVDGQTDDMLAVQYEMTPISKLPERLPSANGSPDAQHVPAILEPSNKPFRFEESNEPENINAIEEGEIPKQAAARPVLTLDTSLSVPARYHTHGSSTTTNAGSLSFVMARSRPSLQSVATPMSFSLRPSATFSMAPLPTPIDERRQSLAEYERRLTLAGDDRRRPSTMNLQMLVEVQEEDRQASISAKTTLRHASTRAGTDDEQQDCLMTNALLRHQQEKTMFRSESKRRESLMPSQSSPTFAHTPDFGQSSRSLSVNAIEVDPLDKGRVDSAINMHTSPYSEQTLKVPLEALVRLPSRASRVSSVAVESVDAAELASASSQGSAAQASPSTGSPAKRRIGTSLASWSRFASHTRADRCGSAGTADNVITRDFATEHSTDTSRSSPIVDHGGSPASKVSGKASSKGSKRSSMTSISRTTFGGLVKYYHNLINAGSGFSGQNRRTSVNVSGKLKQPELELLPPLAGDEHHSNSTHKHLKEIEKLILEDVKDLTHLHHHSHHHFHHHHPHHATSQQAEGQGQPPFEFRSGSPFAESAHKGLRRAATEAVAPGSPFKMDGPTASATASPTLCADTIVADSTAQVDGTVEFQVEAIQKNIVEKCTPSRAEAWSRMYQTCLARHIPTVSISNADRSARGSSADTDDEKLTSLPALKPVKARSPEARTRLDPNVRIRRFPSVTVVDDRKGHLRSVSLISAQSLRSSMSRMGSAASPSGGVGEIQRNSTYDLIEFVKAKEREERDKLLGIIGCVSEAGMAV